MHLSVMRARQVTTHLSYKYFRAEGSANFISHEISILTVGSPGTLISSHGKRTSPGSPGGPGTRLKVEEDNGGRLIRREGLLHYAPPDW